jgi:RNA polymerase sigma-70 factor (ECF subfamily)
LRQPLPVRLLTGGTPIMETLRQVVASSESHPPLVLIRRGDDSSAIRDEAQLIESILAGNTNLYQDLVRPYEALVYRMAFMMLRNDADAEDAAQEAFLRAYRKLASFRSESRFSTWLTSIVLNEARARLRRRERGLSVSLDSLLSQETLLPARSFCDKQESALRGLERAELQSQLQRAILDLPAIYREVLQMRLLDERSIRNTAQALMSTEGVVKSRLHRARRMLQRRFSTHRA